MELNFGLAGLNLRNYSTIFKNFEFGKYLFNSVSVVVIACFFNAVISSTAGLRLRKKKKFVGSELLFAVLFSHAHGAVPGDLNSAVSDCAEASSA